MDDNDSDDMQRQDYGKKSDKKSGDKEMSNKPLDMIKAGKSGDGSGPTGSSREYPKGSKVPMTPDFNPMDDKKRSGTGWCVDGVE